MKRRDVDPEDWAEQRDQHAVFLDRTDVRGSRGERDLEALVHGDTYCDRYDAEQAAKHRPAEAYVRTMPFDVAWTVVAGEQRYVAVCGCTWYIDQTPRSTCPAHVRTAVPA